MELGNLLDSLLNGLVNMVAQEALKYTILSGIVTALTWPASLITVASVIDNPWGVCLSRSAEVGKHLAQILLSRQQVMSVCGLICVPMHVINAVEGCCRFGRTGAYNFLSSQNRLPSPLPTSVSCFCCFLDPMRRSTQPPLCL
ncbi:hypothetical protein FKM82_027340 [Ascaphus truei]